MDKVILSGGDLGGMEVPADLIEWAPLAERAIEQNGITYVYRRVSRTQAVLVSFTQPDPFK